VEVCFHVLAGGIVQVAVVGFAPFFPAVRYKLFSFYELALHFLWICVPDLLHPLPLQLLLPRLRRFHLQLLGNLLFHLVLATHPQGYLVSF
jgi:hypothetical protein